MLQKELDRARATMARSHELAESQRDAADGETECMQRAVAASGCMQRAVAASGCMRRAVAASGCMQRAVAGSHSCISDREFPRGVGQARDSAPSRRVQLSRP
jgi:hypothetical protein